MVKDISSEYCKYSIAELNVLIEITSALSRERSDTYATIFNEVPDMVLELSKATKSMTTRDRAECSDEFDFLEIGRDFYIRLPDFGGMYLHASAVVMDGRAYLFSAPPGTGKSTHTALWRSHFGPERAVIINDDSPALRLIDGTFLAFGTPWSGGTRINCNMGAPVQAIGFLTRSEENWIKPAPREESIRRILTQTLFNGDVPRLHRLLDLVEKLVVSVPAYNMGCNMDPGAAQMAYDVMSAG